MMVYRIMLRRKIYSELLNWKNEPFKEVLVVKGARQVGKTSIIEQFIKENFERHLTIGLRLKSGSPSHVRRKSGRRYDIDRDIGPFSRFLRGPWEDCDILG